MTENQIESMKTLERLTHYKNLRQLDIMENPVVGGDDFKKEILIKYALTNPLLRRINDDEVTEDDLKEAMAEKEERIKAEEAARREAEANPLGDDGNGDREESADE